MGKNIKTEKCGILFSEIFVKNKQYFHEESRQPLAFANLTTQENASSQIGKLKRAMPCKFQS